MLVQCLNCKSDVAWEEDQTSTTCPNCGRPVEHSSLELADSSKTIANEATIEFDAAPISGTQKAASETRLGNFELLRPLGKGGFADVYLGRDVQLDRQVAIKLPRRDKIHTLRLIEAFRDEARVAAGLKHPNIVNILQVGSTSTHPCYIVMEYVDGQPLSHLINGHPMEWQRAVCIMVAVARAIQFAHSRGVVHRDLKPANILITANDHPIVLDFGLGFRDGLQWERDCEIAGTPAYMPPEQKLGDLQTIDGRADVWSLGVTLYQLLTGNLPFGGRPDKVFDDSLHVAPRPMRQFNPTVPRDVNAATLRCLSPEPSERFDTAADFADALESCLQKANKQSAQRASKIGLAIAAAVVCFTLLPLWGVIVFTNYRSDKPKSVETIEASANQPVDSDTPPALISNAWNNMLERKPRPLAFPVDDRATNWFYNPDRKTLSMVNNTWGYIEIGEAFESSFMLRVEFSKNSVIGDTGIYFGHHSIPKADGTTVHHGETIALRIVDDSHAQLLRQRFAVSEKESGFFAPNSCTISTSEVALRKDVQQFQIQIEFEHQRLRKVLWNNNPITELCDNASITETIMRETWKQTFPEVRDQVTGNFGCINAFGDATFELFLFRPLTFGANN